MTDNQRTTLIVGAASLVLIGVGFGVYKAIPKPQERIVEQTRIMETTQSSQPSQPSQSIQNNSSGQTLKQEDWKYKKSEDMSKDEQAKMLKDSSVGFVGAKIAQVYPSEKEGYTTDITKKTDEYGLPNLKWTPVTSEEAHKQVSEILAQVTSPIYGKWKDVEIKDERNLIASFTTESTKLTDKKVLFNPKEDFSAKPEIISKGQKFTWQSDTEFTLETDIHFFSGSENVAAKKYIFKFKLEERRIALDDLQIS